MKVYKIALILSCFLGLNCQNPLPKPIEKADNPPAIVLGKQIIDYDTLTKTIHVFVALCDNKYQSIAPVPAQIGDGQNPNTNMYWGGGFGVRSFFKNSKDWVLITKKPIDTLILERLVFKNKTNNYYLVADAFDGRYIKTAINTMLHSTAGHSKDTIHLPKTVIGINGNAALLAYIGHNGLMNFDLSESFQTLDKKQRTCIVLVCKSAEYFAPILRAAGAKPLLLTTDLMCPEAYTLHDALTGFLRNESDEMIRTRAVKSYIKYQKCDMAKSENLFVNKQL
jgi:hypothetical protein